jgi:hypothetical protein
MPIQRLPLTQPIESRTASFTKDSRSVNGYFETRDTKREFIKRPGLEYASNIVTTVIPEVAQAQGLAEFRNMLIAVIENTVYKIDPTTYDQEIIGTIDGVVAQVWFVKDFLDMHLVFHNGTNGYYLDDTFALTQLKTDNVIKVNIITGGTTYPEDTTVVFGAPPVGGTQATGTVQVTGGVITGVTVTNGGSGYLTAPSVTFSTYSYTSPFVINTSGTNILTVSSYTGTITTGMTVTGIGVPVGTTVTAVTETSPYNYTIEISNNTTASVAIATFSEPQAGAEAVAVLNAFPAGNFATNIVFLDQYIFIGGCNNRIYNSYVGDCTKWNALDYLSFEQSTDRLLGIAKHFNYLVAFGEWSTQFYYDAANATGSPLANSATYMIEIGVAAPTSIVQSEQTVIWVGKSKNNGASVYLLEGTSPQKVSTHNIDRFLTNSTLEKVTAYTVKVNGHLFYILSLHDTNVTLVYDLMEKTWYQWTQWAKGSNDQPNAGVYGESYFRPSYYAQVVNKPFVLDDDNGSLYIVNPYMYTDNNAPIYYRSVSDNTDSGTTKRKFFHRIEIIGDKIPATMLIRHTEDDYNSWSNYRQVDLSKPRAQLYQCGQTRRRAWEFLCTDDVPLRIDSAEIDFSIGEMEQEAVGPTQRRG